MNKQRQLDDRSPSFLRRCLRSRKTWIVLALLLCCASYKAYHIGRNLWAKSHFRDAEAALERRDFSAASFHLDRCLEVWPDYPEVRLLAARTARRQGNFAEAERQLRLYQEQNGSRKQADLERRLRRVQQGDYRQAPALMDLYADRSENPENYLVLEAVIEGSFLILIDDLKFEVASQGKTALMDISLPQQAVDRWLTCRTGQADQAQGLVWRGMIHSLARDLPRAQSDFEKALELDPDHFKARMFLADLLALAAPERAARQLEILLARSPENNAVRLKLAAARRSLGQCEVAARILDDILAAAPNDIAALVERGKVALDARQSAEAERWLKRAVTLAPNLAEANLTLSRCLQEAGKDAEAKQYRDRYEQIETERKRQRDEWIQSYQRWRSE